MVNAQQGISANQRRVESLQLQGSHFIFVDSSAVESEQRLEEVQLINPTIEFKIFRLRSNDLVGQISEVIQRSEPLIVRSLWIISGSEPHSNALNSHSRKPNSILDKRIAEWQAAFSPNSTCYLIGDDLTDLADQIGRLTGAVVKRDFEFAVQTVFDEVIFIDHAVHNFESFVKNILLEHDANIVALEPTTDGLQQIAQYLRGRSGIKAIHLICPGNESSLVLGRSILNQINLKRQYTPVLREIGHSLTSDSVIRIYNNQFNSRNCGIGAIRELCSASGAFVIVANSKSQELEIDSDFQCRFSPPARFPTETEEWNRLLPPLNLPAESTNTQVVANDRELSWNSDQTELLIQTRFDRVQAIAWVCIGFAAGGISMSILFGVGFW